MTFSLNAKAVLELMRPFEWSKTLGNMVLGSVLALYIAGLPIFTLNNLYIFIIGFIAAGPLLWSGLYALNDYFDREKDKRHPIKRLRAIPSGRISDENALFLSLILIVLGLFIGVTFASDIFFLCLFAMLINQLLYTMKPFDFKKRPILDLVSGSLINPFFRFYAGWVLFVPLFNAPLLVLLFVLGFQFAGFTLYRLSGRKLEAELKYRSSVVVFGEKPVKALAYLAGIAAGIAFIAMAFTIIPIYFLALAVLSLFSIPLYKKALLAPEKMDMKKMYSLIYMHYLLFILGFVIIFWLIEAGILAA